MPLSKYIVTTTIHSPTKAILEFCHKRDWNFIIVGDKNTPHQEYLELEKSFPTVSYLSPVIQERKYPKVSDAIGWESIQRRNIGFIEAYHRGAQIMATVDDDNIPYEHWGKEVYVGQEIAVDSYSTEIDVFDPLSVTDHNYLWHRGYPIQLLQRRHEHTYRGKVPVKVLVQADLWDGDPDIDAVCRLAFSPKVKFDRHLLPFSTNSLTPFNSQNTFLSREVIPFYCVIPHIGRMDDIWGSYILQHYFGNCVVFCRPSVYQARNPQDLLKNLEQEMYGYRNTQGLIQDLPHFWNFLPPQSIQFIHAYRNSF